MRAVATSQRRAADAGGGGDGGRRERGEGSGAHGERKNQRWGCRPRGAWIRRRGINEERDGVLVFFAESGVTIG
jgi:hypothetical protein